MNRLLSGNRARVLLVTLLSAVLGITGLGVMPTAAAAPQGAIEGTVTDADGAGIRASRPRRTSSTAWTRWTFVASSTTKNDGSYALKKLPAATLTVEFFDNEGRLRRRVLRRPTDDRPGRQRPRRAGSDRRRHRRCARPDRRHPGTVTDEQGQPLPGIFIDVYTLDEDGFPTGAPYGGTTNDAGRFVAPFIPPGAYIVGFTDLDGTYVNEYYDDHLDIFDSDLVTVTAAGVTAGIDAELALGGRISGTVTDSVGSPSRTWRSTWPGSWTACGPASATSSASSTEDDGTYEVGGLPAGTWQVGFIDHEGNYLTEYYDDAPTSDDAIDPSCRPAAPCPASTPVSTTAAHLQGTVTDEEGTPARPGRRHRVVGARWRRALGGRQLTRPTPTAATPSTGCAAAATASSSRASTGENADEFYDDVQAIDDGTPVEVDPGTTVGDIDAQLAEAAHITGTVTGPDGQPFEIVAVVAWRFTGAAGRTTASVSPEDDERGDAAGTTT